MFLYGGLLEKIVRKIFEGPAGIVSRFFRHDYNVVDIVYKNAAERSAIFVYENMSNAIVCRSKEDLWRLSISYADASLVWLEFGVYKGNSINFFSNHCKSIYGFDSFEGLEENWNGNFMTKGMFNMSGKFPKVNSNVKLIKGYFNISLPKFINNYINLEVSLIHLDCDTYESTIYVLNTLQKYFTKNAIIIFDDFFGAPGYEVGQYKALFDFINLNNFKYEYLGYSRQSISIKIIK